MKYKNVRIRPRVLSLCWKTKRLSTRQRPFFCFKKMHSQSNLRRCTSRRRRRERFIITIIIYCEHLAPHSIIDKTVSVNYFHYTAINNNTTRHNVRVHKIICNISVFRLKRKSIVCRIYNNYYRCIIFYLFIFLLRIDTSIKTLPVRANVLSDANGWRVSVCTDVLPYRSAFDRKNNQIPDEYFLGKKKSFFSFTAIERYLLASPMVHDYCTRRQRMSPWDFRFTGKVLSFIGPISRTYHRSPRSDRGIFRQLKLFF